MEIKKLTIQEYENKNKSGSLLSFFRNEKDICRIVISNRYFKSFQETVEILETFISLGYSQVYEIENEGETEYLIYYEESEQ